MIVPLRAKSADTAIIIEPVAILARATSRRAPPAAISALIFLDKNATGVLSNVKLAIFVGVLTNGSKTLR